MSEAHPPIDEDEAALAEIARMDLSFARHVHAQAMATTDPEVLNGLGRTYQRVARSLRQTIMAKARLRLAREKAAAEAARAAPQPSFDLDLDGHRIDDRVVALQDAVGRVAAAAFPDSAAEAEAVCERFDLSLDVEVERPDFLTRPLDDQVSAHCERLGLPAELVARWRDLPVAPWAIWTEDDSDEVLGPAPPPLKQDSG
jgi:hypothetical protein